MIQARALPRSTVPPPARCDVPLRPLPRIEHLTAALPSGHEARGLSRPRTALRLPTTTPFWSWWEWASGSLRTTNAVAGRRHCCRCTARSGSSNPSRLRPGCRERPGPRASSSVGGEHARVRISQFPMTMRGLLPPQRHEAMTRGQKRKRTWSRTVIQAIFHQVSASRSELR